jgi:hypothetical protein
MKTKTKELDVDFMGGQGPLTKEEEEIISSYLKNRKILKTKTVTSSRKNAAKRNVEA